MIKNTDEMVVAEGVTRFEYITSNGRQVVEYLKEGERLVYCYQDDGRTLKVFKTDKTNLRIP